MRASNKDKYGNSIADLSPSIPAEACFAYMPHFVP